MDVRQFLGVLTLRVAVVIFASSLILYALKLIRMCCDRQGWSVWEQIKSFCETLARPLRADDPLYGKVYESVLKLRIHRVSSMMSVTVHLFAFLAIHGMVDSGALVLVWGDVDPDIVANVLIPDGLVGNVAYFMMCLICVMFPQVISSRSISALFFMSCAISVVRMALGFQLLPSNVMYIRVLPELISIRLVFGLLVNDVFFASVSSFVVSAASAIHMLLYPASGLEVGSMIFREFVWCVTTIVVWTMFDRWTWMQVHSELQVKTSSQAVSTVRRLLNSLCDAVVVVGEENIGANQVDGVDLCIQEPSPRLAQLLLKHDSINSLRGSSFLGVVEAGDQQRVKDFVSASPSHDLSIDPIPAPALHVHLRDSSGAKIQAELFHSCFIDIHDKRQHLIGICEVGDTGARTFAEDGRLSDYVASHMEIRPSVQASASSRNESSDRLTSECSRQDSVSHRKNPQAVVDAMGSAAWVGNADMGALLLSMCEVERFPCLVEDPRAFEKWMQDYVHDIVHGGVSTFHTLSRTVILCGGSSKFRTVCTMGSVAENPQLDETPEDFPVTLTFSALQRVRGKSRPQPNSRKRPEASMQLAHPMQSDSAVAL